MSTHPSGHGLIHDYREHGMAGKASGLSPRRAKRAPPPPGMRHLTPDETTLLAKYGPCGAHRRHKGTWYVVKGMRVARSP